MKKKKKSSIAPVSNFVVNTALAGAVTGALSNATGQGSGLTSAYVSGATKGVKPAAGIASTTMVLNAVNKIKVPRMKGGKKEKYGYKKFY